MAVAFVQSKQTAATVTGTAPTVAPTSNVVVGNFLLVAVFRFAPATVESCTLADNLGNTYTARGAGVVDTIAADNVSLNLFSAPVTTGGACTITATLGASRFGNMIVHEVSGTSLAFDNSALNTAAATATTDGTTSGTATVAANAMLVGFACDSAGSTAFTVGTGFTSRIAAAWTQSGTWVGSEEKVVSGGTLAGTWTGPGGGGGYVAGFLSVKEAATTLPPLPNVVDFAVARASNY